MAITQEIPLFRCKTRWPLQLKRKRRHLRATQEAPTQPDAPHAVNPYTQQQDAEGIGQETSDSPRQQRKREKDPAPEQAAKPTPVQPPGETRTWPSRVVKPPQRYKDYVMS